MRNRLIFAVVLSIPMTSLANIKSSELCFPKNNLDQEDRLDSLAANMSEATFNSIISSVTRVYAPIVKSHGATLEVERNWDDSTVNAYALRSGNQWLISMFGGLARRPEITPDGFALVVCHELGHHLAGFAFKGERWAASEGQSDYFATHVCARKIWASQTTTNGNFRSSVTSFVKSRCDSVYRTTDEQNLCYRLAKAGDSLAALLSVLGNQSKPRFDQPDPSTVSTTAESHPAGQCRLDTYFHGSLCRKAFPQNEIPGFEHSEGQASVAAESEAAQSSCVDGDFLPYGTRPRCWFAPQLTLKLEPKRMTKAVITGDSDDVWEPGESFAVNFPILNNLGKAVNNASLTIYGPNSRTTVQYPVVNSEERKYATKSIPISLPSNLLCGDRVHLTAEVAVGTWTQKSDVDFQLGKSVTVESASDRPNSPIPDDPNRNLTYTIYGRSSKKTSRINLSLDISHAYPKDLQMTLISPSGKAYIFYDRVAADPDKMQKDFAVFTQLETIRGQWQVKIADQMKADSGTLNAVNISFTTPECAAGLQLTQE